MIEELQPVAFPLVNHFFRANGHKGKARSDERVFVLRQNGSIAAALRACPKGEGYLLRSVWVSINQRRTGLGLRLTRKVLQALQPSPCWCYPYAHLEPFYLQAGMTVLSPEQVPDIVALPWRRYQEQGHDFLLMGMQINFG